MTSTRNTFGCAPPTVRAIAHGTRAPKRYSCSQAVPGRWSTRFVAACALSLVVHHLACADDSVSRCVSGVEAVIAEVQTPLVRDMQQGSPSSRQLVELFVGQLNVIAAACGVFPPIVLPALPDAKFCAPPAPSPVPGECPPRVPRDCSGLEVELRTLNEQAYRSRAELLGYDRKVAELDDRLGEALLELQIRRRGLQRACSEGFRTPIGMHDCTNPRKTLPPMVRNIASVRAKIHQARRLFVNAEADESSAFENWLAWADARSDSAASLATVIQLVANKNAQLERCRVS